MNKKKQSGRKKRIWFLSLLLAVLCIGGVELAACRYFDPALYQQITTPVREGAAAVAETVVGLCRQGAIRAAQRWSDLTAQAAAYIESLTRKPDPILDTQLATDPTVVESAVVLDPSITELKTIDGREVLTGGILFDTVYFNQSDEIWASQPYGSDHIGGYGCGPTAMAMVVATLTDTDTNPAAMSQWAVEHGYWASGHGSYLSIVAGTAQAYGLQAESLSDRTPEAIREALLSGKILVALMGPGHFTQGGHFILLRGITLSGTVLVADPNSTQRSLISWDPQVILDELSASTSDGAPLWVISPAEVDS